jgi:NAD(P)-dependent dehydrogenase (short-subunit alcohol dehydrogenase family)
MENYQILRKPVRNGSDQEKSMGDINTDLMDILGLTEGSFAGRVALVTGSARGIGEATVRALAFLGAKVIIVDRLAEQGRAVAASIRKAGRQARFLRCDLSKPGDISRLIPRAQAVFGPIDLLVNNALYVSVAPLVAYDLKEWEYTFAVNARAPFLLIKAFLPGMIARGGGTLVNVVAYEGTPLAAIYAAGAFSGAGDPAWSAGARLLVRARHCRYASDSRRARAATEPGYGPACGSFAGGFRAKSRLSGPAAG